MGPTMRAFRANRDVAPFHCLHYPPSQRRFTDILFVFDLKGEKKASEALEPPRTGGAEILPESADGASNDPRRLDPEWKKEEGS